MSEPQFFAGRLKQLREKAGLSQSALAQRSSLSVSAIRQFEYGLREPIFGSLVKIAAALGVSLSAFDVPGNTSDPLSDQPEDATIPPAPVPKRKGRKKDQGEKPPKCRRKKGQD